MRPRDRLCPGALALLQEAVEVVRSALLDGEGDVDGSDGGGDGEIGGVLVAVEGADFVV